MKKLLIIGTVSVLGVIADSALAVRHPPETDAVKYNPRLPERGHIGVIKIKNVPIQQRIFPPYCYYPCIWNSFGWQGGKW